MTTSGKITTNFTWDEAASHDGERVPARLEPRARAVAAVLEIVRSEAGDRPIKIRSWYRSEAHNKGVGSTPTSQHRKAHAVDVTIRGLTTRQVYDLFRRLIAEGKIPDGGLGFYPRSRFVHYDLRGKRARWSQRS